eukprot:2201588-Alexandrium_andersonii.AAC.1
MSLGALCCCARRLGSLDRGHAEALRAVHGARAHKSQTPASRGTCERERVPERVSASACVRVRIRMRMR